MIKHLTITALALGAATTALLAFSQSPVSDSESQSPAPSSEPVLVELFTSQGCSSCPPADRLAERIAGQKGLVVISRPVDYWDRLGWEDTLASPANSNLQRDYAKAGLAGQNGVYTPQVVVNGTYGDVGSNETKLLVNIRKARGDARSAGLRVEPSDGDGFAVALSGQSSEPSELVLVGVASHREVSVGRGENRGQSLTYTNAVVAEEIVGEWTGGDNSFAINPDQLRMQGADRFAVILREQSSGGRVLATDWLD